MLQQVPDPVTTRSNLVSALSDAMFVSPGIHSAGTFARRKNNTFFFHFSHQTKSGMYAEVPETDSRDLNYFYLSNGQFRAIYYSEAQFQYKNEWISFKFYDFPKTDLSSICNLVGILLQVHCSRCPQWAVPTVRSWTTCSVCPSPPSGLTTTTTTPGPRPSSPPSPSPTGQTSWSPGKECPLTLEAI